MALYPAWVVRYSKCLLALATSFFEPSSTLGSGLAEALRGEARAVAIRARAKLHDNCNSLISLMLIVLIGAKIAKNARYKRAKR